MGDRVLASDADMRRLREALAAGRFVVLETVSFFSSGDEYTRAHKANTLDRAGERRRTATLVGDNGQRAFDCVVDPGQAEDLERRGAIVRSGLSGVSMRLPFTAPVPEASAQANIELLLGLGIVQLGERVPEGVLVESVAIPWVALAKELERDPSAMFTIDPRKCEEIIAASYKAAGFDVILTPRSGDLGRDVIATKRDLVTVRVFDQVKRYGAGRLVPADDVRALWGVLSRDQPATHAVLTTTSDFAPGIHQEFRDVIGTRLELRNGGDVRQLIARLAQGKPG